MPQSRGSIEQKRLSKKPITAAGFSRESRSIRQKPSKPNACLRSPLFCRMVPGYNGAGSGHNNYELYDGRSQKAQLPLWGLSDETLRVEGDDYGSWRPIYVPRVQHPTRRRLLTRKEREAIYIQRIDQDIQSKYYSKHHHHHHHHLGKNHPNRRHHDSLYISATQGHHHSISREEFDALMRVGKEESTLRTEIESSSSSRPQTSATVVTDTDFSTLEVTGYEGESRPPTTNSMQYQSRPGTANTANISGIQNENEHGVALEQLDFGRRQYNEAEGFREIRPARHFELPPVREDQVKHSLVACHDAGRLSVDFESGKVRGAFWSHSLPRRLGLTLMESKRLAEAEVDVGEEEPEECTPGYVADVPEHFPPRGMEIFRLMVPRVVAHNNPTPKHLPAAVAAVYRDEDLRKARSEAEAEEAWSNRDISEEESLALSKESEVLEEKAEEEKLLLSQILIANAASSELRRAEELDAQIRAEGSELALQAVRTAFEASSKETEAELQTEIDTAKGQSAVESMKGMFMQDQKLKKAKALQERAAKAEALARTSNALSSLYAKSHEHSIDNLEDEALAMRQRAILHQQLATKHSKGRWMQAEEKYQTAQKIHKAIIASVPMCFTGGASRDRLLGLLDERDLINNDEKLQRDQLRKAQIHRKNTLENVRNLLEEKARTEGENVVVTEEDILQHKQAVRSQKHLEAAEKRFATWETKIVGIADKIADCVVLWVQRRHRIKKAIADHSIVVKRKLHRLEDVTASWIQAIWSGYLIRVAADKKMDRVLHSDEDHAAWVIQSWVRKLWKKQESEHLKREADILILEAATIKIQSVFRSRRFRKKAHTISTKKVDFMRENIARRLQQRWRYRRAKRHVAHLRKSRKQLAEHGAVTLVQSVWRRKLARRARAKALNQLEGRRAELLRNFAIRIGFLMRLRIRSQRRPICLKLINAMSLAPPTHKQSDVSAIVTIRPDGGTGEQVGVTRSAPRGHTLEDKGEVAFQHEMMLAPGGHNADNAIVIFTLVSDRGNGHALSFLGQASMPLTTRHYGGSSFRALADNDVQDAKNLQLHGYRYEVLVDNQVGFEGGNGKLKPLKMRHTEHFEQHLKERLAAAGDTSSMKGPSICVRYRPQSLSTTKAGFVSRHIRTGLLRRAVWRPFYCALTGGKLFLFEEKQQALPKDVIVLRGAIPEVNRENFTITFTPKGQKEKVVLMIESKDVLDLRTWAHRITNASGGWSQDSGMGSGMSRKKVVMLERNKTTLGAL